MLLPSHPPAATRRCPRRALAAAVVLGLTGLVGLAGAAPASGHGNLVRSEPADGATITTAPERIRLVFDEDVRTPATVVVTRSTGERVPLDRLRVEGGTVTATVGISTPGRYTVAYRVVSADGHPAIGQITFRFVPQGTAAGGSGQSHGAKHTGHDPGPGDRSPAGRTAGFIAAAGLLGGLLLLTARRLPAFRGGADRGKDPA